VVTLLALIRARVSTTTRTQGQGVRRDRVGKRTAHDPMDIDDSLSIRLMEYERQCPNLGELLRETVTKYNPSY
jgi:hypothetical protein